MEIYILLLIGTAIILVIQQYILPKIIHPKITYPGLREYGNFVKDMASYQFMSSMTNSDMQSVFMKFVVKLGAHSLDNGEGIGYFKLPDFTPVYVLSTPSVIGKFYQNSSKFSQNKFFNRLALILGDDNLMSAELGSNTHGKIRNKILGRNESFRSKVAPIVSNMFEEYYKNQGETSLSVADFMDLLSRRVLLATYFGEAVFAPFERLYNPELTQKLMGCLFNLEPIRSGERANLAAIRNEIFALGCELIFSPDIKKELLQQTSWLNYLLTVRVRENKSLQGSLSALGINQFGSAFEGDECEILINYAKENGDKNPLSARVRDVVNESLFIPLLGFDATASMLLTALRITIQDKRIYSILREELSQRVDENPELHSAWGATSRNPLTFTEAVIFEALRLAPPAPMIPEIVTEPIDLDIDGSTITLQKGSMVLMPLQVLHIHQQNFPDIALSALGQQALDKKIITAEDIFPERWGPVKKDGVTYNEEFFEGEFSANVPNKIDRQGGLLTFKTAERRCPGLRLALVEGLSLLKMVVQYNVDLTNEEALILRFNYEKPLQRNGGKGLILLAPRTDSATSFCEVSQNTIPSVAPGHQEALTFFAPPRKKSGDIESGNEALLSL